MSKSYNVFVSFLECLSVKHTRKFSNRLFSEHPHRYNLYGLSKMLSDYGVENKCLKFNDKDTLPDIETPFIAHIGNDFVIVTSITESEVAFIWKGKTQTTKRTEFCDKWTGIVLLAETNEKSIEPDYRENRKSELLGVMQTYTLILSVCLLIVTMYAKQHFYKNLYVSFLLGFNVLGGIVGFLLVRKQINSNSEYVDKICSLFGGVHGCNDILQSKAAKFMGLISWSEIGLAYFISNILLVLFCPNYIPYLALINIFALPYSLWSVWYQKAKASQWCVLCLIVQFIFWAIFFNNLTFGYLIIPTFSLSDIFAVAMFYLVPLLLISILTPTFSESNKIEKLSYEINSIKADEDVFSSLLKKQKHYEVDNSISKIVWGNPFASVWVTILTNPHCEPCGSMHFRVEKLLKNNRDKVCVQYIFSFFDVIEGLTDSNRFLISAYLNSTVEESAQIYSEWFKDGRYRREAFYKQFNFPFDAKVEEEFIKHNNWIEKTKLVATPTILVNGYYLPDNYKIEDLEYFLDDV